MNKNNLLYICYAITSLIMNSMMIIFRLYFRGSLVINCNDIDIKLFEK